MIGKHPNVIIPERVVRWTAILGFVAWAASSLSRGVSYFPSIRPDLPPAVALLDTHGLPIQVWAVFWCISGLMLFATLFVPHRVIEKTWHGHYVKFRYGDIAILWTLGLYLAWGFAYYMSWIIAVVGDGGSTDYVLGFQYIAIGILGFAGWAYWTLHRQA